MATKRDKNVKGSFSHSCPGRDYNFIPTGARRNALRINVPVTPMPGEIGTFRESDLALSGLVTGPWHLLSKWSIVHS